MKQFLQVQQFQKTGCQCFKNLLFTNSYILGKAARIRCTNSDRAITKMSLCISAEIAFSAEVIGIYGYPIPYLNTLYIFPDSTNNT